MKILSHRGYWIDPSEKNTLLAFKKAMEYGFGVEIDVRDYCGELVVSHDIPSGNEMYFREFLSLYASSKLPIAINIKSDGLAYKLKQELESFHVVNYYVFDMSVPDMLSYDELNMPFFTRFSEFEQQLVYIKKASGIWLDSFISEWYNKAIIDNLLTQTKSVCIVSPELHQRNHIENWQNLKLANIGDYNEIMLCTDFPAEAQQFFSKKL